MSGLVQNFSLGYQPMNKCNVFSSGDYISGQITFELLKDCKIDALWVKMKGKAQVRWTENYGRTVVTYYKKEKYFSVSTSLIQAGQGASLPPGSHVYPFTFQIPVQDLPATFKGPSGKIQYTLTAYLSRSMRPNSKAKEHFTVAQSGIRDPSLMTAQQSTADKKMKLFTSGSVSMDVKLERSGFVPGEGMKVVASIQNNSSRDIKPKYCLYRKYSYFAKGKRRVETKDILKEVGEIVPPSASQTVTRIITIPPTTGVSILNCSILKAEHRLRVYLDVKFASDPEIKFPVVILPAPDQKTEEELPPYPAYGFEALANSLGAGTTTFGPSAPPPSYGTYNIYPPLTGLDGRS